MEPQVIGSHSAANAGRGRFADRVAGEPDDSAPGVLHDARDGALLTSRGSSWFELALATVLAAALLIPGLWSYSLVDPWETHYAEVSRRMLQDNDFVHTKWQNEGFESKPVLTFWLIASSMQAMDIGDGGGFSGEMTSTETVMLAVRLPFAVFGILGLVLLWWMLARLVNRRVAWLSFLIVGTTPFYFFVARQSITDMPLVACVMGMISCLALGAHAGDRPLRPLVWRINALHVFLAALGLLVLGQALYYAIYFTQSPWIARGLRFPLPSVFFPAVMTGLLAIVVLWTTWLEPIRTVKQVFTLWLYLLLAVSVLAKGVPGVALIIAVWAGFTALTGRWRALIQWATWRVFLQGVLIVLAVAIPWHIAMWLKDGPVFIRLYVITHNLNRGVQGVFGERGTFDFFISQIGIGMWPWVALLPAAVAGVFNQVAGHSRAGHVRIIIGAWAVAGVAMFCLVQTKFHHYILPAIPALGVLIAFWIDDWLSGRVRRPGMAIAIGIAISMLLMQDLMDEHKQLIELFVFRYDRDWPLGEPWNIDLSDAFLAFGLGFAALLAVFALGRARRLALSAFAALAVGYALWCMHVYMVHAGTHWGMRDAVKRYYDTRQIHGIDVRYFGTRQLADDWDRFGGAYIVESVIPEHLAPGQPMTVHIELMDPNGRGVEKEFSLRGQVSRIGHNRFWIDIAQAEVAPLAPYIAKGKRLPRAQRKPWSQVDADRLIAWQLYWRGENFWSGDEIWSQTPQTQTAFKQTDNKAFLAYLKDHGIPGRRYFIITEAGRAGNLRNILPTEDAKDSYEILDTTSNKFTLLSFTL